MTSNEAQEGSVYSQANILMQRAATFMRVANTAYCRRPLTEATSEARYHHGEGPAASH